jgi:hypothetical protein
VGSKNIQSGEGRPDNSIGYRLTSQERVPSVSELLGRYKDSAPLRRWERKLWLEGKDPEVETKNAAGAGHLAHDRIECHIKGRAWVEPPRPADCDPVTWDMRLEMAQEGFDGFAAWFGSYNVQILGTEKPMVSEQFRFGGTPDAWGTAVIGGVEKKIVLDWKTSNSIYSDYVMQCAAYRWLLKENLDWEAEEVHIVRVGKIAADFHHHRYTSRIVKPAWECFVQRLRTWEADRVLDDIIRPGR